MATGQVTKDRKYYGHRSSDKTQTISWPKGKWQKTDNIMAKALWPWYCLFFVTYPLAMILSVFCHLTCGHDIFCLLSLTLWPWYCLSTISWPKGKWQKTDNIMATGQVTKDRQYHGQRVSDKRQKISWPQVKWQKTVCLLSLALWPWYCLSFVTYPLAMILSIFCHLPFGHDIVCLLSLTLWPWYCLSFVTYPLAMILSVFCHFYDNFARVQERFEDIKEVTRSRTSKKTDTIMTKG
jgi:uncharacterized membrane protein